MVKLAGAVMTGLASGYFGLKLSMSLKKRIQSLNDIDASLELLESEISFSANRLEGALRRADRNGLFTAAADGMNGAGIKKAWENAVDSMKNRLCLADADCEALYMLGSNIGRTDAENQIKHIKYVKSAVRAQAESAQSEYDRFGRLYRSGGILVGLMIIIILS